MWFAIFPACCVLLSVIESLHAQDLLGLWNLLGSLSTNDLDVHAVLVHSVLWTKWFLHWPWLIADPEVSVTVLVCPNIVASPVVFWLAIFETLVL